MRILVRVCWGEDDKSSETVSGISLGRYPGPVVLRRCRFSALMFCSYSNVFTYNTHSVVFQLKWFKGVYNTVWEMAHVLDIQWKGTVVPQTQNYVSADCETIVFYSSGLWWKFPKSEDDFTPGEWMLIMILPLSKSFFFFFNVWNVVIEPGVLWSGKTVWVWFFFF